MNSAAIVWFGLDLRLADQPALQAALAHGGPVLPVFIWSPEEEAPWSPGAASRWWLHHSLAALERQLRARGSRLIVRRGPALLVLTELLRESGARAVFWNRRYEPAVRKRDALLEQALHQCGCRVGCFDAALLHDPERIRTRTGEPYRVFTAFWRRCIVELAPAAPRPAPERLAAPQRWPRSLPLEALELLPQHGWADGFGALWQPGETGAQERLQQFLRDGFELYARRRDRPDCAGTSRLSPHLHFGEISPAQIWHAVVRHAARRGRTGAHWRGSAFLREMVWREFAHHLLYHYPHSSEAPLRPEFADFGWRSDPELLRAWQRGRTGYPIVDAGMRELWASGWMHNRVRMIVASFLVKDLLIHWQEGARWFWDTLVDADLANNTLGWQWSAGCGADAAPYFRIFNPALQGMKFDPQGGYVRRWCPELAALPDRWIHQPERAPKTVLEAAGLQPGVSYPRPIVNHLVARAVALETFAKPRSSRSGHSPSRATARIERL